MDNEDNVNKETATAGKVLALPCHKLIDHPLHMGYFSQPHLAELTRSIKENGLLEPILVYLQEDGQYCIIKGHNRVRAFRRLKRKKVLCYVYPCDHRTALIIYCTSHLLDRGLSVIEEGYMLVGLMKEGGFSMTEIGELWGRSKSWVSRRIKLIKALDPQIMQKLSQGDLKPRHAQELARLPQGNEQNRVLELVKQHNLNKDNAAKLIDWWLNAKEEERCRLEETGGDPLPEKEKPTPISLGEYVVKLLKQGTLIVDDLTVFLQKQDKPFGWWPKEQYQSFLAAVELFKEFIPEGR